MNPSRLPKHLRRRGASGEWSRVPEIGFRIEPRLFTVLPLDLNMH